MYELGSPVPRILPMSTDKASTVANAPLPWRITKPFSEIAAINDAHGRTLFICRDDIARVIVDAVNKMEAVEQR
jgi:hypothetical protein